MSTQPRRNVSVLVGVLALMGALLASPAVATSSVGFKAAEGISVSGSPIEFTGWFTSGSEQLCEAPAFEVASFAEEGVAETLTTTETQGQPCPYEWSAMRMNGCQITFEPQEEVEEDRFVGTLSYGFECGPIEFFAAWGGCWAMFTNMGSPEVQYTNMEDGSIRVDMYPKEVEEMGFEGTPECGVPPGIELGGEWEASWSVEAAEGEIYVADL